MAGELKLLPADEPRFLTLEEIRLITEVIRIPCIFEEVSRVVSEDVQALVASDLKKEKLFPEDIPKMAERIKQDLLTALVEPGDPVNFVAAQALGEITTQMIMNAHKTIGKSQKLTLTGLPRLQELLGLKRDIRTPVCFVYFEQRLNLDQIRSLNRHFVFSNVESVLESKEVSTDPSTFLSDSWSRPILPERKGGEEEEEKADLARLRFKFNKELLTLNRIRVDNVARIISHTVKDKYDLLEAENKYDVQVFASPQSQGLIDLYVNPDAIPLQGNIAFLSEANKALYLLNTVIYPLVAKERIGGIPGITKIFPREFKLNSLIEVWDRDVITLKPQKGIKVEFLVELLTEAGFGVRSFDSSSVILTKSGSLEELGKLVAANERLKELSSVWILETEGTNLVEIQLMKGINHVQTTSNSLMEINKLYGIDAARNFLIEEIFSVIGTGKVQHRQVMLLADVMTHEGFLIPANKKGLSRQRVGTFVQAAFEEAQKHIIRGAAFGSMEDSIKNISTAIAVGNRPRLGTNSFDLVEDPNDTQEPVEQYTVEELEKQLAKSVLRVSKKEVKGAGEEKKFFRFVVASRDAPPSGAPARVVPAKKGGLSLKKRVAVSAEEPEEKKESPKRKPLPVRGTGTGLGLGPGPEAPPREPGSAGPEEGAGAKPKRGLTLKKKVAV